jgi:hypothetical protein
MTIAEEDSRPQVSQNRRDLGHAPRQKMHLNMMLPFTRLVV